MSNLRAVCPTAQEQLESCLPNSTRATAKQLPRPPRQQSARKRAPLPKAPEHDRVLPNSARALRAPSNCFRSRARPVCKHFGAPQIARRTACSPQNRQALEVTKAYVLKQAFVAATKWRTGTPSPERGTHSALRYHVKTRSNSFHSTLEPNTEVFNKVSRSLAQFTLVNFFSTLLNKGGSTNCPSAS